MKGMAAVASKHVSFKVSLSCHPETGLVPQQQQDKGQAVVLLVRSLNGEGDRGGGIDGSSSLQCEWKEPSVRDAFSDSPPAPGSPGAPGAYEEAW